MQFRHKAKYFVFGAMAAAVAVPLALKAVETIPVVFAEGDIISAEVMNQLFARVNDATRVPSAADLVGRWSCMESRQDCEGAGGWTQDGSGLFCTRTQEMTFSGTPESGSLALSTSAGWPLRSSPEGGTPMVGVPVALIPQTRLLTFNAYNTNGSFLVTAFAGHRFELSEVAQPNAGTCVRLGGAPQPPQSVTLTASADRVALSWVDQSSDETGFKVQRKQSAEAEWNTIATAAANGTSHADTGLTAGTYRYRVLATNSFGDSMSSTEVQAEIQ